MFLPVPHSSPRPKGPKGPKRPEIMLSREEFKAIALTAEERKAFFASLLPICERMARVQLAFVASNYPESAPSSVSKDKLYRVASRLVVRMAEEVDHDGDGFFDEWCNMVADLDLKMPHRATDKGEHKSLYALEELLFSLRMSSEEYASLVADGPAASLAATEPSES